MVADRDIPRNRVRDSARLANEDRIDWFCERSIRRLSGSISCWDTGESAKAQP